MTARRTFLAVVMGGLVGWPLVARAQPSTMLMIGFLSSLSARDRSRIVPPFLQGLSEAGYVEGRNLAIEYRWAEGHYERLPALADDLVRRHVLAIAALSGTPAGLAARAATPTIPIVFAIGGDPVGPGLVSSLSRPSGNVTGVTFFTAQLAAKRLQLLHELVPKTATIGVLVNQKNPPSALEGANAQTAAEAIGRRIRLFDATIEGDIDRAFAVIAQQRVGALFVSADPFFLSERNKLVTLAARHAVPAIYADREYTEAGGLISYGASRTDAYRQAGIYIGRILKGEKPSNLPVIEPTKFELLINLKTARLLALTIPQSVLLQAEQIIE
jgi:putative tryptophan/tyrosine transport system substrate-binding protein